MIKSSTALSKAPRIAVCVDKSRAYGVGVLQGLADYMELHTAWSVFLEPFRVGPLDWAGFDRWEGNGILALLSDESSARQIAKLKIPAVDVAGEISPSTLGRLGIPCVTSDHRAIGRLAADHLALCGYSRHAFVGFRSLRWVEERWAGFSDALADRPVARHEFILALRQSGATASPLTKWNAAQDLLSHWIAELPKPVGIFACNDSLGLEILDACRRLRLDVPDEVGVLGVDNDEVLCRLARPPLSSIVPDPRGIGFEAARTLHGLMGPRTPRRSSRSSLPAPLLIAPLDVAARASTQGISVSDELIARALRFIRENAASGITAEEVLRETGMSRRAFFQRFYKAVGCTPHTEISRVRLAHVKRLLRETDLSLELIADRTGYCSSAHMSVAFKRETGIPPGEYRRGPAGRA